MLVTVLGCDLWRQKAVGSGPWCDPSLAQSGPGPGGEGGGLRHAGGHTVGSVACSAPHLNDFTGPWDCNTLRLGTGPRV